MSATQNVADDTVYDRIEALLARDLPRQGRIELMQVLEGVAALLSPAHSERTDAQSGHSEFSDSTTRVFPMGRESAAH
jgi:hypothetical protein